MIPRRLWLLWLQGIDNAPAVVRACLASWGRWNPGWQIELLDLERLLTVMPEYRDWGDRWSAIGPTALSDLIRVNLLTRFGGVWADATCLCRKPLDAWLPHLARTGFFAFSDPAPDRLLASWFLAAEAGTPLVARWREESHRYWEQGPTRGLVEACELLSSNRYAAQRADRQLWFDEHHSDYRSHYPYFWFHYLFERLLQDPDLAARWRMVPKMTADIPHRIQQLGLRRAVTDEWVEEFRTGIAPLYKLTYKGDLGAADGDTLLGYSLDPEHW